MLPQPTWLTLDATIDVLRNVMVFLSMRLHLFHEFLSVPGYLLGGPVGLFLSSSLSWNS